MKTVKSTLLGAKSIDESNTDVLLFNLKEIIKEHRNLIIGRLLKDLPTYIAYKYNIKSSKQVLETAKDQLSSLQDSGVDLNNYQTIVNQVLSKEVTHLTNEPFYFEIDGYLSQFINSRELKFA